MDININVTLDPGTTKAVALLAESILAAASELGKTAPPVVNVSPLAPSTPEEHAEATPPKRTRKSRAKAAEAKSAADEGKESSTAAEPAAAKTTRGDVRKAAGAFLEADGERQEIKGWLEEFGSESITTLDEKHFPAMVERLTA